MDGAAGMFPVEDREVRFSPRENFKRNDLAKTQPEPPTGGDALSVLLCAIFF
jgi:hypothetical protein